jgi:phthalate 4,5-dioxygenase oxygenase subunit
MLTHDENERLCRVGPGTDMGNLMRRYWIPALLSTDLPEPDGDPRKIQLLGESFVAFRDSSGKVGILDELCKHRGASLALGRVEAGGIRCIYHGWKYSVDGTVMETPNVAAPNFKNHLKCKGYPVREAGGVIWVYLGKAAQAPEFVNWPFLNVPESNRVAVHFVCDCNWLGVLEGTLDSSHLSTLHTTPLSQTSSSELSFAKKTNHLQFDTAPRLEVEETEFGMHYAALRQVKDQAGADQTRAMITGFVPPFYMVNPMGDLLLFTIPMSDERTLFYHIFFDPVKKYGEEPLRSQQLRFIGADDETLASLGMTLETCDSPDRARIANNFHQDRAAMRAGHYTGLQSFTQEDHAVIASAGAIRDRSTEILCTADAAIARLHRILLRACDDVREGREPRGFKADLSQVRGTTGPLAPEQDWRALVPTHRLASEPERTA